MRNRSKRVTFRQMDTDRVNTEYETTEKQMGFKPPNFALAAT